MTVSVSVGKNWDKAPVSVQKISDLVLDYSLYPRKEIDQTVVQNYAKALEAGCVFPTVKIGVLAGKKIIVDGVHRVRSRGLAKIDYVDCAILAFESEAALFAEAVRLNSGHGKGFSDVELKANIKRLEKYKFSVKDIQILVHVPASEIHRECAAPVTVLTLPSGKKISCQSASPKFGSACNAPEVIQFKNYLKFCSDFANAGRIPVDNAGVKELVVRCRLALGKVRFNA